MDFDTIIIAVLIIVFACIISTLDNRINFYTVPSSKSIIKKIK
jgi:hypothetical protein